MPYMQAEIHEQPQVIQRLLVEESANIARVATALHRRQPAVILITARGTSDNAATYAKYLFGLNNQTIVALAAPSLATIYNADVNLTRAAVIGISQSGQSPDVVEVMRRAKNVGAMTIGITNNPVSPLAAGAEYTILLHAGEEKALPATKTYTAELMALALLSAHMAGNQALLNSMAALPDAMQSMLKLDPIMHEAAQRFSTASRCVCLARGLNYATALESALKLKETCYVLAEPYSTADFLHGPIALLEPGFPGLLFAAPGKAQKAMLEIAGSLKERGAASIIVARDAEILKLAEVPVTVPVAIDELLSPIAYIVPAQLFALHLAQAKGIDPDAPRGLNKVTLTR
jgi:glutamine---fructose-6-phosphate transaminase (isomerizing)